MFVHYACMRMCKCARVRARVCVCVCACTPVSDPFEYAYTMLVQHLLSVCLGVFSHERAGASAWFVSLSLS